MTNTPFFSIIIPVYNGGYPFERCLQSIQQSTFGDWELIVVDDGSDDGSDVLAQTFGAVLLRSGGRLGPAAARNYGARIAKGQYIYFVDADCELHAGTLARMAQIFNKESDLDALFGSYDDAPGAANFIAQYKNLFHHYVHQHSHETASTFWTGCGAIKRTRFLALGGFDAHRYRRPAIEDIDLGYRLKQAGGRIRLAKQIQVKHLKAWTLAGLLRSDILDRGIPWTRLILHNKAFSGDLNLQTHNRLSVVAIYGALLSLLAALWQPYSLWLTPGLALLLLWLNFDLYHFFYRRRGLLFALRVIPIHWLYYFYNVISFGCGLLLHWRDRLQPKSLPQPQPLVDGNPLNPPRGKEKTPNPFSLEGEG